MTNGTDCQFSFVPELAVVTAQAFDRLVVHERAQVPHPDAEPTRGRTGGDFGTGGGAGGFGGWPKAAPEGSQSQSQQAWFCSCTR